ncbi:helix-turn-helix domain-containing protein [Streptomyces sp. H27-S2]|uniref:helix-turn-helix domain-containing protein n=1 Tax=Streptomyces antarcticus TaxID=2996458 RepID=UPI00226F3DCA|nr:helix-turn-helix transcriptional regulator [Streptomyces sp. H27-S2]MCY0952159.1 helix-turn-helix transcriptional regulator [Streptomyces sp. H27-S2]
MGTGTGMGTGSGTGSGESERFARLMRELKERAGLSYGALARKLHTSTSTLHRYCNGEAVPTEFAVVDRFARVCGASQGEAVDLHRAWLLADARRRAGALGAGAVPVPVPVEGAEAAAEPGAASEAGGAVDGGAVAVVPPPAGDVARESARDADADADPGAPAPAPAAGGGGAGAELGLADVVDLVAPEPVVRLPWYRRRAAAVTAAGVTAGVVAVAVLAAAGPERPVRPAGTAAGPSESAAPAPVSAPPGATATAPGSAVPSPPPSDSAAASGAASAPGAPSASAPGQPPGASAAPATGPGPAQGPAVPVRAAVRSHVWAAGCDHAYLTGRGPAAVPPPPVEADAPAWASAQRAVHAGQQILEVTVHGAGAGAVVLEGLDVRVTARRTPPAWNVYQMSPGCGGALTPAVYAVNLDAPRPVVRPVDGGDSEGRIPAPAFPMRVSAAEPVVLRVKAATTGCDCDWYLDLRYTGPSGSGSLRIDDNGRPLRTAAATGRPVYGYASDQGRWAR